MLGTKASSKVPFRKGMLTNTAEYMYYVLACVEGTMYDMVTRLRLHEYKVSEERRGIVNTCVYYTGQRQFSPSSFSRSIIREHEAENHPLNIRDLLATFTTLVVILLFRDVSGVVVASLRDVKWVSL